MELWTITDFLTWADLEVFSLAENIIATLLADPRLHRTRDASVEYQAKRTLRLERAIAACEARLGRPDQAALRMERMIKDILNMNKTMMLLCDMDTAIYLSQIQGHESKAQEFSQHVFFGAETLLQAHKEGRMAVTSAFQRRLTEHGLTHFEFGTLPGTQIVKPAPFVRIDRIGRGAFAEVESVELYGNYYARKSMFLRRSSERQLREMIENEISVIKSMRHSHIVSIYCTYQEKQQYSIILEPLAQADLETFLDQQDPTSNLSPLLEKWILCLATTLAYMHGHGVRHKDIKTKNILVKGTQIVYSDFGSSRAFLEENAASTEGPAYGHTRMYSAPEVIAWERRNTSADVFSLGCVLTEIVSVLCGRTLKEYHDFRYRMDEEIGRPTQAYHATLDLVDSWFSDKNHHLPTWGCKLFAAFIKPMLQFNGHSRPSATETSNTMKAFFEEQNMSAKTFCQICYQYPVADLAPTPGIDDSISLKRSNTGLESIRSLASSVTVMSSSITSSAAAFDSSTTSSFTTNSSLKTSSSISEPAKFKVVPPPEPYYVDSGPDTTLSPTTLTGLPSTPSSEQPA
jgi:serine/threonine protein kinase